MGGGDLNTKKSWHPNTLKNQERVWAAERAAEVERTRVQELRRERLEERGREELRALGQGAGTLPVDNDGDKLAWMYNQPNKSGDTEDYLLGKTIDKNYERLVAEDKTSAPPKNAVEHEVIPFSIRQLRAGAEVPDTQVDLARKLQEDPLAAVRQRELEARAQLLQNPLRLHQLTQLLRQDKKNRKQKKEKKKAKKNKSDIDKLLAEKLSGLQSKNIDLACLLSGKKKKKKRKHSSDSSSDSSSEEGKSKSKKKKKELKEPSHKKKKYDTDSDKAEKRKKKLRKSEKSEDKSKNKRKVRDTDLLEEQSRKKRKDSSDSDSEDMSRRKRKVCHSDVEERKHTNKGKSKKRTPSKSQERRPRRRSEHDEAEKISKHKHHNSESHHKPRRSHSKETERITENRQSSNSHPKYVESRRDSSDSEAEQRPRHFGLVSSDGRRLQTSRHDSAPVKKMVKKEETWRRPAAERLSEQEKEKRLREMMSAASDREKERSANLEQHRRELRHEELRATQRDFDPEFASRQAARAAGASSVTDRIRSNRNNIQRADTHMQRNFAKR